MQFLVDPQPATALKRVLLIEDGVLSARVRELLLSEGATEVVQAASGDQALEELLTMEGSAPFCLVLLDLDLPDMSGLDGLQAIRSKNLTTHLPVVVFSRADMESVVWTSYRLGATAFVVKPSTDSALKDVVSRVARFWVRLNVARPSQRASAALVRVELSKSIT